MRETCKMPKSSVKFLKVLDVVDIQFFQKIQHLSGDEDRSVPWLASSL